METHCRINLWSSPRNISTALMYSFAQRTDTTVVDEPLYAHYLARQPTAADHPGGEAILRDQSTDGREVVETMLRAAYPTPVVVFKQMTHHLVDLPDDFLYRMVNVLLIRDPREILASFTLVVETAEAADIGVPQQGELFDKLVVAGTLCAVVDATRLLSDPRRVLEALCTRVGIAFEPGMLSWPAGPKAYDGVWAPHWYGGVHRSTGFMPYRPKDIQLPPRLDRIAEACMPVYRRLLDHAI